MKSIITFFVRNTSFTMVLILAILALGFNSLMNMPRGEDPVVNFPRFFIVAVYPGASPIDLEDQVVDPLESRINELDEIKKVKSTIEDALAIVDVEYEFEVDREEKYQEIIREVNIARAELPKDLYLLEVQEFNSSDVNIFQMALLSQKSAYAELEEVSEQLVDQLEKIVGNPEVDEVRTTQAMDLLSALAADGQFVVLAAARNDFYQEIILFESRFFKLCHDQFERRFRKAIWKEDGM